MNIKNILLSVVVSAVALGAARSAAAAQTVEKVADLNSVNMDGVGAGGTTPQDRFTQAGTNLYFTTKTGGAFGFGGISRFNLATHEVQEVASLDNNSGKGPDGSLVIIGDDGYFTTVNGGTGDKGTISKVNLVNGVITTLYAFPVDSSTGATPRAGLTRIGDELWTTTSLGGTSNRGVIVKFNLTNNVTTVVTNLDGPLLGGQPYGGFLEVGGDYYFTTPIGGTSFATTANVVDYTLPGGELVSTTNNLSLGAGTLQRLTFDAQGNPAFTRLVNLRGGFEEFSYSEPVLVGSNAIYFATAGPNTTPGAIMRYDLTTGASTNVYLFANDDVNRVAYGTRPGYNGLLPWQDELYFINRLGGTSNYGTVVKFNVNTRILTKLADLEGNGATSFGRSTYNGNGANSGLVVEETNRYFVYFPIAAGGAYGLGTIIRVSLPPLPIQATLTQTNAAELSLAWSGGYPPFAVQGNGDLTGIWTNVVTDLTNRQVVLPVTGGQMFFRVTGSE